MERRQYGRIPDEVRPLIPPLVDMVRRLEPGGLVYEYLAQALGVHWRTVQNVNLAERAKHAQSASGAEPVGVGGEAAAGDIPLPFEGWDDAPAGPGHDDRGPA